MSVVISDFTAGSSLSDVLKVFVEASCHIIVMSISREIKEVMRTTIKLMVICLGWTLNTEKIMFTIMLNKNIPHEPIRMSSLF
jgi:hypothetical protein